MRRIAFVGVFMCLGVISVTAQTQINSETHGIEAQNSEAIDRSVYMDDEEKVCYIDLEKIPVNLKQAAIINNRGDEVVTKSLADEPVDTIVELDYSELPKGAYILELRSYRGTTSKAIQL